MIKRAYYRVTLTAQTLSSRPNTAKSQGVTLSQLAHETPKVVISPDNKYALVRLHWDDSDPDQDRALYESASHVAEITNTEAADLKRAWSPPEKS